MMDYELLSPWAQMHKDHEIKIILSWIIHSFIYLCHTMSIYLICKKRGKHMLSSLMPRASPVVKVLIHPNVQWGWDQGSMQTTWVPRNMSLWAFLRHRGTVMLEHLALQQTVEIQIVIVTKLSLYSVALKEKFTPKK